MIKTFFKLIFAEYHVFCKWIMVRHLAECNKKANSGKKIKNHFRKPFLDLECSNFAESVSRPIRNYCKITFFYSKNRPSLMCMSGDHQFGFKTKRNTDMCVCFYWNKQSMFIISMMLLYTLHFLMPLRLVIELTIIYFSKR